MTTPTTSGSDSGSGPFRVSVRLPVASSAEFLQKYKKLFSNRGLYIPTTQVFAIGSLVHFELLLRNGSLLLRGQGRVVWARGLAEAKGGFAGVGLRFTQLEPLMRQRMEQFLATVGLGDQALQLAAPAQAQPQKPAHLPPAKKIAPLGARKRSGRVLGIDLGTTNSACSVVERDAPYLISKDGATAIPSVVAIDDQGSILVGHPAKLQMVKDPTTAVHSSKRLIGRSFHSPTVQAMRRRMLYDIFEGDEGEPWVRIAGKEFSLTQIASLIIGELRRMAELHLGEEVNRAVISVPAYYNEGQRSAVRLAGELAGMHVERIVSEPTAAALAYGYRWPSDQRVLVYDLGGGTFDASLLDLSISVYEVVGIGGDNFLGGSDFDERLLRYCLDHLCKKHKIDLTGQTTASQRLKLACEAAKCLLSEISETEIKLPYLTTFKKQRFDFAMPITRSELHDLTGDLVAATIKVCDQMLSACGVQPEGIDNIILVGGQSRFPLVRQRMREHFGFNPDTRINPDEAVALGAALLGHSLDRFDAVVLIDVLPMSLGVGLLGGVFHVLFSANTSLPATADYAIATEHDNQDLIEVPVFQGESDNVLHNEFLGTLQVDGVPPGPAGSHCVTITVSFSETGEIELVGRIDGAHPRHLRLCMADRPEDLVRKLAIPAERIPQLAPFVVSKDGTSEEPGDRPGLFVRLFGGGG